MPQNDTLILRVALEHEASIFREIEIEASKSLYRLAEAIVKAFDFDFDHAFGFYSGLTPTKMMRTLPKYELFADMGEADPGVLGVKKTKVADAFPSVGHTMLFLFDYGDDWHFRVKLRATGTKVTKFDIRASLRPRARRPRNIPIRTSSTTTIGRPGGSIWRPARR